MDPLLVKVVTGVIAALVATVGILWKENRKWQTRFMSEQLKCLEERQKRLEDLKEHGRTSEMFLLALEKKRRASSDRPPSSR